MTKRFNNVKFDVTKLLHEGKNATWVEVGNGWFLKEDEHYTFTFPAFMPPNPNPYRPFGKELVLAISWCWIMQMKQKKFSMQMKIFR